jgi:hypothetical protein
MRVRLKGINSITKTLADGTRRTYWYAWKGGPPLRGEPGTPEFIHSYNVAIARKVVPPRGTLLSVAAHALRHDARKPSDVHGLPSLLVSMIGERFSGRSRADRLSSESPMWSWRRSRNFRQHAVCVQAQGKSLARVGALRRHLASGSAPDVAALSVFYGRSLGSFLEHVASERDGPPGRGGFVVSPLALRAGVLRRGD